jgi:aerobic-type carbon monoxide dehydrogenase small subunit (CoxS/CutS family)
MDGDEPILTTVNGLSYTVYSANAKTLLHKLREDIGLTGTKEGCAEGENGALPTISTTMAAHRLRRGCLRG